MTIEEFLSQNDEYIIENGQKLLNYSDVTIISIGATHFSYTYNIIGDKCHDKNKPTTLEIEFLETFKKMFIHQDLSANS